MRDVSVASLEQLERSYSFPVHENEGLSQESVEHRCSFPPGTMKMALKLESHSLSNKKPSSGRHCRSS